MSTRFGFLVCCSPLFDVPTYTRPRARTLSSVPCPLQPPRVQRNAPPPPPSAPLRVCFSCVPFCLLLSASPRGLAFPPAFLNTRSHICARAVFVSRFSSLHTTRSRLTSFPSRLSHTQPFFAPPPFVPFSLGTPKGHSHFVFARPPFKSFLSCTSHTRLFLKTQPLPPFLLSTQRHKDTQRDSVCAI
jgi:hypothetical protein